MGFLNHLKPVIRNNEMQSLQILRIRHAIDSNTDTEKFCTKMQQA